MKKIQLAIAVLALLLLCGCDESKPMTEEQWAAYRANCIHRYEVLSVFQYAEAETNRYGGVHGTDICYAFTYLDANGSLKSVKGFEHLEYGLTKVCIGEKDEYVVDDYGDNMRYLYLSKDTLSRMTGSET